jgi:hypothetical protein
LVDCTEDEFNWAAQHFLEYCPLKKLDNNIYQNHEGPNHIFVVGQKTCEMDSIFTYSLANKEMLNRDRTVVDRQMCLKEIKAAMEETTSPAVIKAYLTQWKNKPTLAEYQIKITPKNKEAWLSAIKKHMPNAVLSTDL